MSIKCQRATARHHPCLRRYIDKCQLSRGDFSLFGSTMLRVSKLSLKLSSLDIFHLTRHFAKDWTHNSLRGVEIYCEYFDTFVSFVDFGINVNAFKLGFKCRIGRGKDFELKMK